jgi:asparagine synthase (glutamine-hydrolysing)
MAHALEVRVPFLDYKLVEYVLSLGDASKYPHAPKKLLTDAVAGLLPEAIIHRKKMGFTLPWSQWMKEDLRTFCEKKIKSLAERDSFNRDKILALWNSFINNRPKTPWYKIWHLAVLENWLERNDVEC